MDTKIEIFPAEILYIEHFKGRIFWRGEICMRSIGWTSWEIIFMIDEILWLDSLEWNIFVSEKNGKLCQSQGTESPTRWTYQYFFEDLWDTTFVQFEVEYILKQRKIFSDPRGIKAYWSNSSQNLITITETIQKIFYYGTKCKVLVIHPLV